jgi:hypothetical protein
MSLMKTDWPLVPMKFEQFDDVQAVVQSLDPPIGASYAYINVQGGDLRWRDDGTDPDADTGHLMFAKDDLWYTVEPLNSFRFIEATGSAGVLDVTVSYYKPVQASDG